jgi:hypothetical protein
VREDEVWISKKRVDHRKRWFYRKGCPYNTAEAGETRLKVVCLAKQRGCSVPALWLRKWKIAGGHEESVAAGSKDWRGRTPTHLPAGLQPANSPRPYTHSLHELTAEIKEVLSSPVSACVALLLTIT